MYLKVAPKQKAVKKASKKSQTEKSQAEETKAEINHHPEIPSQPLAYPIARPSL